MNCNISNFGQFQEYILSNPQTGDSLHVLPQLGGIVRQLKLCNQLIINAGDDPQTLQHLNGYPSALMFPFASRIRNGQYVFENQTYQLPINELARHNAIHGFMAKRSFDVASQTCTDSEAKLVLKYSYHADYEGYPFSFIFHIDYSLRANGDFEIEYHVQNTGVKTMPLGIGWHPYFSMGNESVDNLLIKIPSDKILILDDKMMPSHTQTFEKQQDGWLALSNQNLDNCFPLRASQNGQSTYLYAPNLDLTLQLWQETGPERYNYLVVYTPADRQRIAIEPITNNVDAFNSGDGLISLPAQQSMSVRCRVNITKGMFEEN